MSNRYNPIVPHVLYVADQHHPWRLALYERLATRYHTPTTVSLEFGTVDFTVQPQAGKQGATKQQTKVYCLRDDLAWDRVQGRRAALQEALDALADGLRGLGSYAVRLEQAGGMKRAPNPLSPTVISMPDPDTTEDGYFISDLVPRIGHEEISSHTPKMLHVVRNGRPWSTTHQRDQFVCPDEAAWEQIQALRNAVVEQVNAWRQLLRELGTYQAALADGRYGDSKRQQAKGKTEEPMPRQAPTAPATADFWQALSHAHPTAHHWHHEGGNTYRSACGIRSRHHPLGKRDVGHCSRCTAAIEQPTAPTPTPAEASAAPAGDRWGPRELPIGVIRRDGGTQARVGLNEDVVQEYAEAMRDERWDWATLKRPLVYNDGASGDYWLADGFHRIEAAQRAGRTDYQVEILRGDKRAAQLHAARANADHGLRRSRQDVQRAIELLLRDAEWARWSDREIARHVHCSHRTVGDTRKRLESTGQIAQSTDRQGADGRVTNTAGISQANQTRAADKAPLILDQADDDRHIAAAHQILSTLDQWADSARPERFKEAYSHAREVYDLAKRDALFHAIDRAMEGTAAQVAALAIPAPDPNVCSRCGKPATGGGAMTVDDKRFCPGCAGIYLQETAAAQAAQARQVRQVEHAPAAPSQLAPVRPARPANGDVSVVLEYVHQLERYADQLEQALAALQGERGPVPTLKDIERGPLAEIASEVASIEDWIAETGAEAKPAWIATHQDELRSWRKRLDSLADHPEVDDTAWSALSTRIGQLDRALAELAERAGPAPVLSEVMA